MSFDRIAVLLALLLGTAAPLQMVCADSLASALSRAAPDADPNVIKLAVQATQCRSAQEGDNAARLAVIDYSLPSTSKRLWIFDLRRRALLFHELVAHGRNSGENLARHFSNKQQSLASSLGLYVTLNTYQGQNGYSLRMEGLEHGFNDQAYNRALVIHGAPYVSPDLARANGRIGRSLGCPAVRPAVAHQVIDAMKDGQLLFSYYPDPQWLEASAFINCSADRVASASPEGH